MKCLKILTFEGHFITARLFFILEYLFSQLLHDTY